MAGGIFTNKDKIRPGAYINFKVTPNTTINNNSRGIVAIPYALNWGESKKIIEITNATNILKTLGGTINDKELLFIKEASKHASKILLYRVNSGTKATATIEDLTVTAKYGGSKGNAIGVKITKKIDDDKFVVETYLNGIIVDNQEVLNASGLLNNDYISFSGEDLTETAGTNLTGGTDTESNVSDYLDFLNEIARYSFNVIALPIEDEIVKSTASNIIKTLREEEGKKVQLVVADYKADYEGVISVKNGVILKDGSVINKELATVFVAGITASANANISNTYAVYDEAIDITERYTNSEIEEALKNGEFLFTEKEGTVVIEQDINTLITYDETKNKYFSKNRVLRVLDDIANTVKKEFETNYIGKVSNTADGRNLFKASCINYLNSLVNLGAIENFDSSKDITVEEGTDIDNIKVHLNVQPTDALEKLYMTIEI